MANNVLIDYSNKEKALGVARNEINGFLEAISNVFKDFQEDYLFLLNDHKRLQSMVDELMKKNTMKNNNHKDAKCDNGLLNGAMANQSNNINASQLETPGFIENTPPEVQEKQLINKLSRLKKKQTLHTSPKRNGESRMPKLDISKKSPIKSQSRKLALNKSSTLVRLLPSGKVSRQIKLSIEDEKKKSPVKSLRSRNDCIDIADEKNEQLDDLNIDETLFEVPFSQENTPENFPVNNCDVSTFFDETIPNNSVQRISTSLKTFKDMSKVKSCSSKKLKNNGTSESLVLNPLRKSDKKIQSAPLNLFTSSNKNLDLSDSPILVDESQYFSYSDKTDGEASKKRDTTTSEEIFYPADDTYCKTAEIIIQNQESRDNKGTSRRDGIMLAGPSKEHKKNGVSPMKDIELEVENMSDWDTDMSCDKWVMTPSKKRNLLNSFDVIPEKKKSSPKHACKGPVIRNKADRAKLPGWDCSDCENYYKYMNLPKTEISKRKNHCSRHRSKFNQRHYTPPGFWDPQFPNTISSDDDN